MAGPAPVVDGVERAVFGAVPASRVDDWLDRHLRTCLGRTLDAVLFRSGRVSAVYGCRLGDGLEVAVKVHRAGADLGHLTAAVHAQRRLADAGYPCPGPLHGPKVCDGRTVVVESLRAPGEPADATRPDVRRALAESLVEQVALLRAVPPAPLRAGAPAWARYGQGPWPTPHDPVFDFTDRPARFAWVDALAASAAAVLVDAEEPDVVGHSDWSCGNVRVRRSAPCSGHALGEAAAVVVSAAFDWDSLAARPEAVLAGMSAGSHTLGGSTSTAPPSLGQVSAFLGDYDRARAARFTVAQRAAAAAAACWVLAYNARCELSLLGPDAEPADGTALLALRLVGRGYLDLDF